MKYTEEEKEAIEVAKEIVDKKYGSIMVFEIRDMEKILNLLDKQQKEIERLDKEKINIYENYISKDKIIEKIKEIEDSLKEDCIALHEFQRLAKIDVLKEILNIRRVIK